MMAIEHPAIEVTAEDVQRIHDGTEWRSAMELCAARLHEVVALARLAADHYRASDPRRGRAASLVATHAEMGLLYALHGDELP